jgi:very-short-patch-repair endonuclease
MILDKTVKVRTIGTVLKHYRSLGYECSHGTEIDVRIEDLPKTSRVPIRAMCDYCKKEYVIPYLLYKSSTSSLNKYACKNCRGEKEKEIFLQKYGVSNPVKLKEIREKMCHTNLERYGVKYPLQNRDILDKRDETCIKRYGTKDPLSLDYFKEKFKESNLKIRGVENPAQCPEVKEKISATMYKNNSQKTSSQQLYLYDLYGGELNYPIGYFNIDICLLEEKLAIEYDGGGHMLNVTTGRETLEEYNQKTLVRNNIIKRKGYKQIRIISSHDYLPSDEILLQMLEQAKEYFNTTNHTWVEYNIDFSLMRNAEHKEGVYFNFGELRKIKKIS